MDIIYSIIIPHYNIPDLLIRCLKSIPVRGDIQVIVIDDCSPNADTFFDRFPELSRPYLEYYSTPQGGSAGRARNIGLDHAKGKWIICMDADDLFVDNMEEILLESKDREEDILFYNYRSVYNNNINEEASRNYFYSYFESSEKKENLFRYRFDPMWGKIFKKSMIDKHNIRCDESRYGNDAAFSFKCGYYAQSIVVFNKPFFLITEREGSLSSSDFSTKKISQIECKERLEGAIKIEQFIINNKIKTNRDAYIKRALVFLKEYPIDFIKYYWTDINKLYPNISSSLLIKMLEYYIINSLLKILLPIYHLIKGKNI